MFPVKLKINLIKQANLYGAKHSYDKITNHILNDILFVVFFDLKILFSSCLLVFFKKWLYDGDGGEFASVLTCDDWFIIVFCFRFAENF